MVHRLLQEGARDSHEALAIFDTLEPVGIDALIGSWTGHGFASGHPLDGALEACHWHGKRFDSAEAVHPLLFTTRRGGRVSVNPLWVYPALPLLLRLPWLKSETTGRIAQLFLPLLATRRPRARLRTMVHRGHATATLVYDSLPILDVFRRADANTLMGLMELRGMAQPFFFVLRREDR
ncbi:MAG: hypothetical protein AVDCRST_MAG51-1902 [uncultured Ramlibacter sp.]|uniref:DUF4334 domain-containing protein n=1 Tax=uncultured Ramlibacter sp. TaxID=260755 RepID=A0A6J4PLB8_9BURK|nr:MAG: hypothetical protein AVDCRST_MAG51-1902 [uncultured Ramlibacter sp.]